MDPFWLLLLLPTAAASGWVMAKRERSAAVKHKKLPEIYFKGLGFLLNEQPDKALRVFLEAVEMDSETVEMHLALGNLFRRRGEIERATRIHRNLAARTDLEDELRTLALFELAQDYFKAGLFDRAEDLFQELRQVPEHSEQAGRFLLQIYDQEKEWGDAILIAEELTRASGLDLSESLAQYCCELAEQAIADGKNESAERHLESAFRYNPRCVRAVIQSGRLASMRGNHANAIAIWRGLEHWAPQALGEVVDHLANSYAALGDKKNYRRFLEEVVNNNSDPRIMATLIELVKQEEESETSQALLLDLVRRRPSLEGLCELIKSRAANNRSEREKKDFTVLADLLSQVVGQDSGYHCHNCGFHGSSLHWQCPGCKSWGTVQKQVTLHRGKPPRRRAGVGTAL
ncbi:MAG: lipopolysaccharide assembly protein LapB [Gammaproteobacteria bacterium]|nr:lipopolysaccharide assembly protein LapB [Gammaproteobacteria bacterium]